MKTYFIHAKSAFEGAPDYPALQQDLLVIQESALAAFAARRRTEDGFLERQRFYFGRNPPLTLEAHTAIAVEVLMDLGAPEKFARKLAEMSEQRLTARGIEAPLRNPWSR